MIFNKIAQKTRRILNNFPIPYSIFYFLYRCIILPNSKRKLKFGFCSLCGKHTIMFYDLNNLRETGCCLFCSSSTRYRIVAEVLKRILVIKLLYKDLEISKLINMLNKIDLSKNSLKTILEINRIRNFIIYEPSSVGAIYNILKNYPNCISSEYFPNQKIKKGQYYRGIRFEDLQSLSFEDSSIDIVITQDVFEHIEKPYLAFAEINRVLKPNGIHVFTTPISHTHDTFQYFDEDGKLLRDKIQYHIDPFKPEGVIVYTQFGLDLISILNKSNFTSVLYSLKIDPKFGIFGKFDVIISMKK